MFFSDFSRKNEENTNFRFLVTFLKKIQKKISKLKISENFQKNFYRGKKA